MKNPYPIYAFALIALSLISSIAWANVSSLSREQYRQDSPDEIFWEVAVSCSGVKDKRIIEQRADDDKWCSKKFNNLCARDKIAAAERVCGAAYRAEVTALQEKEKADKAKADEAKQTQQAKAVAEKPKPADKQTAKANSSWSKLDSSTKPTSPPAAKQEPESEQVTLLKTEIQIEEQRIAIEQQKLDLRRRELDLKKQELVLLRASDKGGQ